MGNNYSSIDEMLKAEGFELMGVLPNESFSKDIRSFLKEIGEGYIKDFRIVPNYIALKGGRFEITKEDSAHLLYVKVK